LFVTGASGYLGRHVVAGPAAERWDIVAPSSGALDLRYRDSVVDAIREWRPRAVVHTAYRMGDRAATFHASRNVAEAAAATGTRLVHVSSDAVFAGRPDPYVEDDRPDPVHDYGRDKADAEAAVLSACPSAVVVRTSLLVGRSTPSSHELTVREACAGRRRLRFFFDEVRCPVLVDDVAANLVDLAERPEVTGVLHLAGPRPMSRAELALLVALHHGWDADRLEYGSLADSGLTRPGNVVLDSSLARSLGFAARGPDAWER
jgi:dTDP-4-dehydrorhamnose reductase